MLRILSWNIQQGGGSRTMGILKALQSLSAEIIILSEFKNNDKGLLIRDKCLKMGYKFQFVTDSKRDENAVFIGSKFPANSILHPAADTTYHHGILEIQLPAFRVIGVYLPHKKKHKLFPYIQNLIAASDQPYIIAGDFNSGINGVDQEGNSFWYQPEMKQFEKIDYFDAYRQIHGAAKTYSWYSHQKNGYRYDHTYVHKDLIPLIKNCDYLHDWRENKLSDHSPMLLELG